jgi:tRNA (cytidine/uridine-2'-O-)-methyltransferase
MRLTVNTGCRLHLIEPLGFTLDDARMRRAGLDYREFASVTLHDSFEAYVETNRSRVFAFTQHATTTYTDISYDADDTLLFGRESDGLSDTVLNNAAITERVRIPIAKGGRSLNLANAAAIGIYEAWRQHGFR